MEASWLTPSVSAAIGELPEGAPQIVYTWWAGPGMIVTTVDKTKVPQELQKLDQLVLAKTDSIGGQYPWGVMVSRVFSPTTSLSGGLYVTPLFAAGAPAYQIPLPQVHGGAVVYNFAPNVGTPATFAPPGTPAINGGVVIQGAWGVAVNEKIAA
jgi:hypothetical protein